MIEEVLAEVRDSIQELADKNTTVDFHTDTYNLISWLGESLDSIADTLKKIEAKMK